MMRDFIKSEELFLYVFFLKRHADMKPSYDYNMVSLISCVYIYI